MPSWGLQKFRKVHSDHEHAGVNACSIISSFGKIHIGAHSFVLHLDIQTLRVEPAYNWINPLPLSSPWKICLAQKDTVHICAASWPFFFLPSTTPFKETVLFHLYILFIHSFFHVFKGLYKAPTNFQGQTDESMRQSIFHIVTKVIFISCKSGHVTTLLKLLNCFSSYSDIKNQNFNHCLLSYRAL